MPEGKAPWLGRWDTLLITFYFTQWQGNVLCRALSLLHTHLCSESPSSPFRHPLRHLQHPRG